jgi:hypothetical protein
MAFASEYVPKRTVPFALIRSAGGAGDKYHKKMLYIDSDSRDGLRQLLQQQRQVELGTRTAKRLPVLPPGAVEKFGAGAGEETKHKSVTEFHVAPHQMLELAYNPFEPLSAFIFGRRGRGKSVLSAMLARGYHEFW